MASLRFHKVASLPTSGYTVGDVYYVVGQGIYVATSTTSCTKFAYANAASTSVAGVTSLSDAINSESSSVAATSAAVKTAYDKAVSAANAASAAQTTAEAREPKSTAVRHAASTAVGSASRPVYVDKDGNATACDYTILTSVPSNAVFTDTHNKHTVSFSNGTASDSTGTSITVITGVTGSSTGSDTTISASTTRANVPTLTVTNNLSTRIGALESTAVTGMQYKGTTEAVPSSGKVGDVWKCSSAISTLGAEAGDFIVCRTKTDGSTAATWDVWQANVENNAYFSKLPTDSNYFLISDGKNGALKASTYTSSSFAAASHNQASDTINKMTGYSKPSSASAIAVGDSLNAAIGKLEYKVDTTQTSLSNHTGNTDNPHKVTKAQVGLSNVTNNRQVVGLSTGTTAGHFVTWGANGYTVADSGLNSDSFDAKGTASGLITTLRGGYTDTLQSVANAASAAQTTAEAREPKSTAVRHTASTAVGSATQPVYVDKDGNATACTYTLGKTVPSDAVFTDTHHTYAFTITNGTATATSFTQNAAANLAIKASASGGLTASTSAGSGTLTVNVGVGSGYTIPLDTQITAWNKKWDPVNATTSSKGIASFNSNNFSVSDGAVSLAWAEWA